MEGYFTKKVPRRFALLQHDVICMFQLCVAYCAFDKVSVILEELNGIETGVNITIIKIKVWIIN